MVASSRRDVLERMSAVAIGTLTMMNAPLALARSSGGLEVPQSSMRLTRRITRELGDGKSIVVEREWIVGFVRDAEGWAVEGEQASVRVEVPEALEALADIERRRNVDGAFPVLLDSTGMIRDSDGKATRVDLRSVANAAEKVLAKRGADTVEVSQLRGFMAQLQQSAGQLISRMPQDLFFPAGVPVHERRTLAVPGGMEGVMELSYRANTIPGTGLLDTSVREVVTRLAGTEMRSSESWQLTAA